MWREDRSCRYSNAWRWLKNVIWYWSLLIIAGRTRSILLSISVGLTKVLMVFRPWYWTYGACKWSINCRQIILGQNMTILILRLDIFVVFLLFLPSPKPLRPTAPIYVQFIPILCSCPVMLYNGSPIVKWNIFSVLIARDRLCKKRL